jgi:hypothetical protein
MKEFYENGPEGMPRVQRMSDSTIDWVINGVDTNGMYLDEEGHRKLRNVCHAVAEEVLARISWPERTAAVDSAAQIDATLPPGMVEFRDDQGKVLGRIINADTTPEEGDYMLEFRSAGTDTWYPSPHPRRPKSQAEAYAKEANARDRSVVYRAVPWDGQ